MPQKSEERKKERFRSFSVPFVLKLDEKLRDKLYFNKKALSFSGTRSYF